MEYTLMIPLFWLEPLVNMYGTVVMAVITGGTPVMVVTDDGTRYGVSYKRE